MPIFGSFAVHDLLGLGWDIVGIDPNSLTGSGCVSKSPSSDGRGGWFFKGTWNVLGSCELNRKSAVGCLGIIHRMEFSWCRRGVICLERSRWSWDVHCNSGCSNSLKFQERWCNYQKHSWPPSHVARKNRSRESSSILRTAVHCSQRALTPFWGPLILYCQVSLIPVIAS